jgi:hypothetical protein
MADPGDAKRARVEAAKLLHSILNLIRLPADVVASTVAMKRAGESKALSS